jgi:phosphate acetyltransferase
MWYNDCMTKFLEGLLARFSGAPARVVFPEGDNDIIKQAVGIVGGYVDARLLSGAAALRESAELVADGLADGIVAGIDFTSREVILATRDVVGAVGKTFSACFVIELPNGAVYTVADCAACKNPTAEQLKDIVLQTVETHEAISDDAPRVAMLSFSTFGSGGKDASFDKIRQAVELIKIANPDLMIDGEMQLDAAVSLAIGRKKALSSKVAGRANILITPDLNSGNILYKAMEQFAGGRAYGPILQGFKAPLSDLSRGSTVQDVVGATIITAARINQQRS